MLIIVSHHDQKTFNMLIIKCINSIVYVQRQINYIFRRFKDAKIKIYIDDVIIKTFTFQKHFNNFRKLFILF